LRYFAAKTVGSHAAVSSVAPPSYLPLGCYPSLLPYPPAPPALPLLTSAVSAGVGATSSPPGGLAPHHPPPPTAWSRAAAGPVSAGVGATSTPPGGLAPHHPPPPTTTTPSRGGHGKRASRTHFSDEQVTVGCELFRRMFQ